MEVSIQAVSPELGVQFSSVLASHAGGGAAGAAAAGVASAGAAVWASTDTAGSKSKASTTSAAAARRHAEPIERTIIETLLSEVAKQPPLVPTAVDGGRLQTVINKNRAIGSAGRPWL